MGKKHSDQKKDILIYYIYIKRVITLNFNIDDPIYRPGIVSERF
jgi:hypothetical protein